MSAQAVPPSMVWKGAWNSSLAYFKQDVVGYGGNAFVCLASRLDAGGGAPSDGSDWQQLPSGSASGVKFTQSSPSSSWSISHSLGRVPLVQVFDSSGNASLGDVTATDTTIAVVFSQPQTGFVIYQ